MHDKIKSQFGNPTHTPPTILKRAYKRVCMRVVDALEDAEPRIASTRNRLMRSTSFQRSSGWSKGTTNKRRRTAGFGQLAEASRLSLATALSEHLHAITSDPPDLSSAVDESSLYPTAALDVQIIPPKLRADQVPDSLDIVYRAVLAEELLLVVKALLEPLSNSTENEAQPLREHLRGLFGYCRTVMPPSDRDTATDIDVSHTDRRGKWNRELLAIVKGGLPESTGNEALRDLCALVCAEMGVVEPLSADGFRFRGEGSKPDD